MSSTHNLLQKLRARELFKNAKPVFEALQGNYALVKGEALSKQIYGIEGMRQSADIDVLIPRQQLKEAERILTENGFFCASSSRADRIELLTGSHQIMPWVKDCYPFGQTVFDLNFDIFWGEYEGKHVNMASFLSDVAEMNIYGARIKVLPPCKAVIQLALHHYKDLNSIYLLAIGKRIEAKKFKDIYDLLTAYQDLISPDELYGMSKAFDVVPYLYYVFYYTNQCFPCSLLAQYVEAFYCSEGEALLDCFGLCSKERKRWRSDFSARLKEENPYSLIVDDLEQEDFDKIKWNQRIFGGQCE